MSAVIEPASSQSNYRGAIHFWLVSLMHWLIGMVQWGRRTVAWVGACLSPLAWLAILVIFTLILTGSVTLIGCMLPGANCLA